MRKKLLGTALLCAMALTANAQVYPGSSWAQLPVVDIYGDMLDPATARMMAELDAKRQEHFEYYQQEAQKAIDAKNWWRAIRCVNDALETGYYNSYIYYMKVMLMSRQATFGVLRRRIGRLSGMGPLRGHRLFGDLRTIETNKNV